MSPTLLRLAASVLGATAMITGCERASLPEEGGARATISIAPLELEGIDRACWDLRVRNHAGELVWERGVPGQQPAQKWPADETTLCSDRFGNGPGGDIAFVGPCDASLVDDNGDGVADALNRHTVTVWLDGLYRAPGADIGDWTDPCPSGCDATFDCIENADVPVTLNFTIMRRAQQGFFDVGVNFESVFCSAKLDCVDAFLHNGPTRDTTVIVGFACTAGEDGQPTTLYLNDILVHCDGDPGAEPPVPPRTYVIPTHHEAEGNHGPLPPGIFQHATYFGREGFTNLDKCYWNHAFGVDLASLEPGCHLRLRGTAAGTPFTTPPFFHSPEDTVYPVIAWDVPLTDASGQLICGAHPLDGGPEVVTTYTEFSGERFLNSYACGGTPETSRLRCDGLVSSVGDVLVAQTADSVAITAGGHTVIYPALPAGLAVESCCPDACCAEVTTP